LFDDPLSALDGNVGEFLMQETLKKQLAGKTRLIITHAMHFLKYADKVYYIENGRIVYKGTYENIRKEAFFQQYVVETDISENEGKEDDKKQKPKEAPAEPKKEEPVKVVDEVRKIETPVQENALLRMFASEDKDAGGLGFGILHTFITNTGGYFCFLLYMILSGAGAYYKIIGARYIFAWAANYEAEEYRKWTKMGYFTAILLGYCSLAGIRTHLYMKLGVRLSRRVHSNMIFRILHAPVEEFIEVVSAGRILNRFTKDVNVVDRTMMKAAIMAVYRILEVMTTFLFMCLTTTPLIVFILVMYFLLSLNIQSLAMKTKREVLRLEAISKSPIVSWATATIKGLSLIRTSRKETWFISKMQKLIEDNLKNSVLIYGLDAWYQLRVSLLNVILVQIPCYAIIIVAIRNKQTL
jgi:ABC-type multidrug transport system fused ATPase/permease subunit